jgi:segregation and condensation protein B
LKHYSKNNEINQYLKAHHYYFCLNSSTFASAKEVISVFDNIMEQLDLYIEALIFAAEVPVGTDEIRSCLESVFKTTFEKSEIEDVISRLQFRYANETYSYEIVSIGNGYQFLTKSEYYDVVGVMLKQKSNKKLSRSALETLAVIAYQQPVSKSEVEKIRGVNCDYAVQKLLEKELVQIKGRSKDPGRPLLYGTSDKFMEHFGLSSLQDLPKLKELQPEENQIGLAEPDEDENQ